MSGNLDGLHDSPPLVYNPLVYGADMGGVLVYQPGAQVYFVRGDGTNVTVYDYDPPGLRERLTASVARALTFCVAGRGDRIMVLPGHTENIGSATAWPLVAGVHIIGVGQGTNRPTFTFTASGAKLTMNAANVKIQNCIFTTTTGSAVTVAVQFDCTVASNQIVGCDITAAIDSTHKTTNVITLSAATAKDFNLYGNHIHGAVGTSITSVLTTTGAVDRLRIQSNIIKADGTGVGNGLFNLSNAAIADNHILNNNIANTLTASKYVIVPHASSTGLVADNYWYTQDSATAPASSGFSTFTTNYQFSQNFCVTTTGASAILCPVADS